LEAQRAFGVAFHLVFRENKAMIGGLPRDPFVFVELEEVCGVIEVAALAPAAVGLDVAELVESLLELAGEALALDAEAVEEAMGVDDVKVDGGLLGGRIGPLSRGGAR
jgi:hypothetical protein